MKDPTIHDEDYDSDDPQALHHYWHNQSVVFNSRSCASSVIHLYVLQNIMIIAEVSDKIPTLTYYWIQALAFVGFGYILTRLSSYLGFGLAVLLLLFAITEIYEFDATDPFWIAVKEEKGMTYIYQSWLSMALSGITVGAISIRKWNEKRRGEPDSAHNSGSCAS